jgi:acyl-CoA synthetase (AMP-forming)/AMP-acid ligase II
LANASETLEPDKTGRPNIGKYLQQNAARYADRPALLFEDEKWTWRAFNEEVNRYANYFISVGLQRGDVMAVLMENRPEMLFVIAAAAKIGAVASLLNSSLRKEGLHHCMTVAPIKFYVIGEELTGAFDEIRAKLPQADKAHVYFILDRTKTPIPENYQDLRTLIQAAAATNPATVEKVTSHDPFAYVFTSGTTGLPKAAFQYHKSWCRAGNWLGKIHIKMGPKDVFYCPLPLFHTNPIKMAWSVAHVTGAALLITRKFSTSQFWNDTRKHNVTVFNYVGELCSYLYNAPEKPNDADNPVRAIIGNGLRPNIFKAFRKRFGIKEIFELYGSSEGDLSSINYLNLDETIGIFVKAAVVKYNPETEEFIKDKNGRLQKAAQGEAGLLLAMADPMVFSGYINKADNERKMIRNAFKDGDAWFNTGDMVRSIGWGHYQFADRMGDTFRWKGENVATMEVEKAVYLSNQVEQCCVYGVEVKGSDGKLGMVSLIPDCDPGKFDLAGFGELLTTKLPAYAVPRFLRLARQFETTPTHKIKKMTMQEEGFNIAKIADPIFILPLGEKSFKPLTPELYQAVLKGAVRF